MLEKDEIVIFYTDDGAGWSYGAQMSEPYAEGWFPTEYAQPITKDTAQSNENDLIDKRAILTNAISGRYRHWRSSDHWVWLEVDIAAGRAAYVNRGHIQATLTLQNVTKSSFSIAWHVASWCKALFELHQEGLLEKGKYVWRKLDPDGPDPSDELGTLLLAQAQASFSIHRVDLLGNGERLILVASCENKNDELFKTCRETLYHDVFAWGQVDLEKEWSGSSAVEDLKRAIGKCRDYGFVASHFEGETAVGIGSKLEKRKAAAKTALALNLAMNAKLDCVCNGGLLYQVAEHIRSLAPIGKQDQTLPYATETAMDHPRNTMDQPNANYSRLGLDYRAEPSTVDEVSHIASDEPLLIVEAEQIQTNPGINLASLPMHERVVSVDDILYSQPSCGVAFKEGNTLRQLVEELHSGMHNPLTAPFLKLELIQRKDKLYSNDNRRLYCLKRYRDEIQEPVHIRARVYVAHSPSSLRALH